MATWGPIQLRLKGSRQVEFDGEASPAPGGGSIPVQLHKLNGVVPGFTPDAPVETVAALLFDPTPQPWQAGHEYSNNGTGAGVTFVGAYVTKTDDPTVAFIAFENGSAVSGDSEPAWSQDGVTTVDDGTVQRPLLWTPAALWAGPWQAGAALTGAILGGGWSWQSDAGGLSGGSEPSWPAAPVFGDTVTDGAIAWTFIGPGTVWQSDHRYSFRVDPPTPDFAYTQPTAIPTTAVAGVDYLFVGQPTGLFGTTGDTEPDWAAAAPGDESVWIDGDIMWNEATTATDGAVLVLGGLVAPSAPTSLLIASAAPPSGSMQVIAADPQAATYDPAAYAAPPDAFDEGGSDFVLGASNGSPFMYANGVWTTLRPGS